MKKINRKAISLVALVITIIVLIILTGTVMLVGIGDTGIFGRATDSVNKYNDMANKEMEVLDFLYEYINGEYAVSVSNEEQLANAIANIDQAISNTIYINNDITTNISITKDVNINLNNKAISGHITIGNNAKVKIKDGTINGEFLFWDTDTTISNCTIVGSDDGTTGSIELRGPSTITFNDCNISFIRGDYGFGMMGDSELNIIDSNITILTGVFFWAGYGTYEETDNVRLNIKGCEITNNQTWGTDRWCCTYSWNTWHDEISVSIENSNFYGKVGGIIEQYLAPGQSKVANADGSVSVMPVVEE